MTRSFGLLPSSLIYEVIEESVERLASFSGGDVTVSLSGPGGTPSAEATVNEDCEWEVEFPDNVLPGSYVVTLTQGDQTVTFVTYVP